MVWIEAESRPDIRSGFFVYYQLVIPSFSAYLYACTIMRYFVLLIALLLLLNCRYNTIELTADSTYFPLETGRYVVYAVDEERFAPNAAVQRQTYQVKEIVGANYTDVTGRPAFRLLRFRRNDTAQAWQPDSVWSVRLTANAAIRTENGVDFIKLVFPLSNRLRWNGNRLNNIGEDIYEVHIADEPYRVLNKTVRPTVRVIQQNDSTLVSQDKRTELYARHVGLIYKERIQLTYCTATPACTGKNQIAYGIRQIYRLIDHGSD